jgi:hypothetical protein
VIDEKVLLLILIVFDASYFRRIHFMMSLPLILLLMKMLFSFFYDDMLFENLLHYFD